MLRLIRNLIAPYRWTLAIVFIAMLVETAMMGVAFVPARVASTVSIAVALGMWLSTGDLYDVAGPVIGTALAARILAAAARPEIAGRRER